MLELNKGRMRNGKTRKNTFHLLCCFFCDWDCLYDVFCKLIEKMSPSVSDEGLFILRLKAINISHFRIPKCFHGLIEQIHPIY